MKLVLARRGIRIAVLAGVVGFAGSFTQFAPAAPVVGEPGSTTAEPAETPPAAATTQARSNEAISKELDETMGKLQPLIGNVAALSDKSQRDKITGEAVPLARKMVGLLGELNLPNVPQAKEQIRATQNRFLVLLYVLGDKDATEKLKAAAGSKDATESLHAKSSLVQGDWILAGKDAKAQEKLAAQIEELDKANPADNQLTFVTFTMKQSAATPELRDRLENAACAMSSEVAVQLKDMVERTKKIKAHEAKPVVIAGKDLDGKDFSTEGWKGKVILVDFWATWCGPCRAELPRVKKMYADYHAKGLEVLGVSNDYSGQALKDYVKSEQMPWPQIFDEGAAKSQKWHPVTLGFDIQGIPVMFLIDKKGILRTVEARETMEDLIPKMLAE
jgi:thiol-disulfide isomerase/thioredoxin